MAREAACMGVPCISFYSGKRLLAVDKKLIAENKMYFSRSPGEIVNYITKTRRNAFDLSRSKRVYEELQEKIDWVLSTLH